MKRSNVVKLVVGRDVEEKLREIATWSAKCWNEVNWLRMQQFKEGRRVDFNETEKAVYAKYKAYLKVNAQQVKQNNLVKSFKNPCVHALLSSSRYLTRDGRDGAQAPWQN